MPVHPTAVIDPRAEVDPAAEIAAHVVIDGPARIGAGVVLGPGVVIMGEVEIGPDCRVHAGAVIGDLPQDRAYAGGRSRVRIGERTVVREHVTIHRGTAEGTETVVGRDCLLLAGAHVAHNCRLGDGVQLINGSLLGGYVEVGDRAIVSGNAAVHQFVRVGELALLGGLAKVTQDVPPFFMVDGPGCCVGVNTVGMRRADIPADDRAEVKEVYRTLYRTGKGFRDSIAECERFAVTAAGRRLVAFLTGPSKRGITAHGVPLRGGP